MKFQLPDWLKRTPKLPPWAKFSKKKSDSVSVIIEVDSPAAYEDWMKLLGGPALSQYWCEVAYQCIKLDVQFALEGTEYDPKIAGKPMQINMSRADKYALAQFPGGKGVERASKGLEARGHYTRIRGRIVS